MKEYIFNVETVSPLMLGNADSQPELRATAVRASARYWFRATAGAVIGDTSTQTIFNMEKAVFGCAKEGSPISIFIPNVTLNPYTEKILPHKDEKDHPGHRKAYRANVSFTITVSARHTSRDVWDCALAMMELALTFGGLGLRARRGYGTLCISNITLNQTKDWKPYIENVIENAVSSVKALADSMSLTVLSSPPNGPCSFPCGNKKSIVRIGNNVYSSSMKAIISFMQGVPKVDYLGYGRGKDQRQASPLWIRPIETGGNKYQLLFISLPSNFTGSDYTKLSVFLNTKHPGTDIPVGGWNQ